MPMRTLIAGVLLLTGSFLAAPTGVSATAGPSSGVTDDRIIDNSPAKGDPELVANPSARRVYADQQLVISYELHFDSASETGTLRSPGRQSARHFWQEALEVLGRPTPVTAPGSRQAIAVHRSALFPLASGQFEIPPYELIAQVRPTAGGQQEPFQDRRLIAQTVSVEVMALPPGAPGGFEGAVGTFSLTAALNVRDTAERATLVISLKGDGIPSAFLVEVPRFPDGLTVTGPTVGTVTDRTGDRLITERTWTFELMAAGSPFEGVIPAFVFPHFDPGAGSYDVLQTAATTLHLFPPGEPESVGTITRHVDTAMPGAGTLVLLLIALVAIIGTVVIVRRKDRTAGDKDSPGALGPRDDLVSTDRSRSRLLRDELLTALREAAVTEQFNERDLAVLLRRLLHKVQEKPAVVEADDEATLSKDFLEQTLRTIEERRFAPPGSSRERTPDAAGLLQFIANRDAVSRDHPFSG
jgi:hypothetical protein